LKALRSGKTHLTLERGDLYINTSLKQGQYFDLSTKFMKLELSSGHYYLNHDSNRTYLAVFTGEAIHLNGIKRDKIGQFQDLKASGLPPAVVGGIPQTIWVRSRKSFKQIKAIIP